MSLISWIRNLLNNQEGCKHNKNYINRQYLSEDRTPMVDFFCYDCGYSAQGHVYANPEGWTKTENKKHGDLVQQ